MKFKTAESLIAELEALKTDAFQGRGMTKDEVISLATEVIQFLKQ
jgi:hypothetical protein